MKNSQGQMSTVNERSEEQQTPLVEQLDDQTNSTSSSSNFRLSNSTPDVTSSSSKDKIFDKSNDCTSLKMVDQVADNGDRATNSPTASLRSDACSSSISSSSSNNNNNSDNNNNNVKMIDQHAINASLDSSLNNISQQQQQQSQNDFESLSDSKPTSRSLMNGCLNESNVTLVDSNNNEFVGKCLFCIKLHLSVSNHFYLLQL